MPIKNEAAKLPQHTKTKSQKLWDRIRRNWLLYLFLLPAVTYIAVFQYAPMYGIQIAFRDFKIKAGFWGSEWVGLKWFIRFFNMPRFWQILKNTLSISIYALVCNFILPIILAVALNNIAAKRYKKFAQTITYMPHFISTVVLVGMISVFFSPQTGFVNTILGWFGVDPIYFLGEKQYFRHLYVWSGVWQEIGWDTIIYMAALGSVSQELHEAAMIDGASKWKRIFNIDLPTILPTAGIMMIMRFGHVMSVGFEKVYLMQNPLNIDVSEVISTYVYKVGMGSVKDFSYGAAVGLFNSVVNCFMLILVNWITKKISDREVSLF